MGESEKASLLANPTRARGNESGSPAETTEVERLVDQIVQRMLRGAWITGESHRELAQEFGISVRTIETHACEASRTVKLLFRWLDDPQATRDWALQSFARIAAKAEELGDAQGYSVAINGAKALAEYTIQKPSSKLEIEMKTPEQQEQTIRQWLRQASERDVQILNSEGWHRVVETEGR